MVPLFPGNLQPARLAERVVSLLRLRIGRWTYSLTLYGMVYTGMVIALLIGSINHNNNLGYLLTFLLGGMLLTSSLYGRRNLLGVEVSTAGEAAAFAGQSLRFEICLAPAGSPRHGVVFRTGSAQSPRADTGASNPETCHLVYPATVRGKIEIDKIVMATNFPMGLMQVSRDVALALRGIVYPQPVPCHLEPEKSEGPVNEDLERRGEAGRDFDGLTGYRPGDAPNRIHWKSLAAGRGMYSKVFTDGGSGACIFALHDLAGGQLERRLGELCHMVVTADNLGMKYGLRLGSRLIIPDRGAPHRAECLKALALFGS